MKRRRFRGWLFAAVTALAGWLGAANGKAQQSTAFTYRGQLHDNGTNANGMYTMIFALYDSASGSNQISTNLVTSPVLTNGLFAVNLDFGPGAFNGAARWLDITVSNGQLQELSPRVEVLPTPYAQFAAAAGTVTNGAIASAQLATNAVSAGNIAAGQVVKSLNGLTDAVSLTAGANVTIVPSGSTLQISATGGGGNASLAAGNNVGLMTNGGIIQISSFVPHVQVFQDVTNATFTVPTNVTTIMVEMWGAGGGGGAGFNNHINDSFGGGGGAGAYAWNVFNVSPNSSYLVTCGAGGSGGISGGASGANGAASSFGGLLTANGGAGGTNGTGPLNGGGGVGGGASGSILNVNGGNGDSYGNSGGVWRGGGISLQTGASASGPGSGGAGGGPVTGGGSPGQPGSDGAVIVYW